MCICGRLPCQGLRSPTQIRCCKQTPILLKQSQVPTLAVHLPVLCVETCNGRHYSCESVDAEFTLSTTKTYRTARLKYGDKYIVYRLHDLQNLLGILCLAHEQQKGFLEALPDILDYANIAPTSSDCGTAINGQKNIQYKQLYEELKSISI
jgi:hypothetical protein